MAGEMNSILVRFCRLELEYWYKEAHDPVVNGNPGAPMNLLCVVKLWNECSSSEKNGNPFFFCGEKTGNPWSTQLSMCMKCGKGFSIRVPYTARITAVQPSCGSEPLAHLAPRPKLQILNSQLSIRCQYSPVVSAFPPPRPHPITLLPFPLCRLSSVFLPSWIALSRRRPCTPPQNGRRRAPPCIGSKDLGQPTRQAGPRTRLFRSSGSTRSRFPSFSLGRRGETAFGSRTSCHGQRRRC